MRFEEAIDYLYGLIDYEKITRFGYNFDLGRFEAFLARVGSPHKRLKRSILVAGTKGKGSTAAMISSVLQAAGLRVGLFTSPHLITVRERIRVNGQLIPEANFAALVAELRPHIEDEMRKHYRTVFEVLTTMAFLHFLQQGVDFAVLEVGLGGRLDSTNVVDPLVSVITSISYDHTDVLGETLDQIAAEKAGIIKEAKAVVSSPQAKEALSVIERVCAEKGARLILVGRDLTYQLVSSDLHGNTFRIGGSCGDGQDFFISMLGRHQVENAATTLATLEALKRSGIELGKGEIREGLAKAHFPGRLEVVAENPWIILDGAHNGDSAKKLVAAVCELFTYEKLFLILGILENKDVHSIVSHLAPVADRVIVTSPVTPRAGNPRIVAQEVERLNRPYELAENTQRALKSARGLASPDDLILVTGSLYLIGEVMELLQEG